MNAVTLPTAPRRGFRRLAGMVPALGVGLLPVGLCPACWPIYAGLASALGLGFMMETQYLLPITAVALVVALGALAFRAKARRGYAPLGLGTLAAGLMLTGKFVLASDILVYTAMVGLVAASVWNSWPRPKRSGCSKCTSNSAPAV